MVVLNEHSGFGSANAAPTAAAVVRKYFELKRQDEVARMNLPVFGPPPPPGMPVVEPGPPASLPALMPAPAPAPAVAAKEAPGGP